MSSGVSRSPSIRNSILMNLGTVSEQTTQFAYLCKDPFQRDLCHVIDTMPNYPQNQGCLIMLCHSQANYSINIIQVRQCLSSQGPRVHRTQKKNSNKINSNVVCLIIPSHTHTHTVKVGVGRGHSF